MMFSSVFVDVLLKLMMSCLCLVIVLMKIVSLKLVCVMNGVISLS